MMEDFKLKKIKKKEVKEELRKYFKEGNLKGLLDVKDRLREALGNRLGNEMYEDCLRKVKEELNEE